jgi:hypothetical protein
MTVEEVNKCISCRTATLGLSCKRMLFTIHDHQAITNAGVVTFYCKGPHPLFWAGLLAMHGDVIIDICN